MTPERRARLVALGALHDEFVQAKQADAPFRPDEHAGEQDYNVHYLDIEADDDEFHRRAREIFNI